MEPSLYKYIWRYSRQEQIGVLSLVLMSAPFYFFSLDLPKQIVNLISGAAQSGFVSPPLLPAVIDLPAPVGPALGMPWVLFGGFTADAFGTLVGLSLIFLGLVVINGAFKMVINTRKGRMGERLLRRLRYELVDRVLRFPPRHYRKVKPSEVASMVKDEVEPLGTFIGDAIVWPAFLGMQAVVAILFILVQSVFLGAIACLILAVQFRLISYLREPILKLIKKRQIQARELAGRVGEIVDGVADIHVQDTSNYERADISKRLGIIYETRFEIYQRKFFVKFVNNFLANFTPFIFYLLGGSLVLNGSLDVGQLVAVIVAYKDLPNPIKELIDWYFTRRDVTIKYEQVIEQFQTADLLDGALQKPIGTAPPLAGAVDITSLSVTDDSGFQLLDALTLTVPLNQAVAVVGPAGCGKEAFGALFARQHAPSTGSIKVAGAELQSLPEGITGRRIGYAAAEGYFLPASLRDNILYGLKNEPRAGSNAGSASMAW
ncbi:MAG TPA: hypothetical protein DCL54_13965, partial [Alphaproteobacteria bacterium]|nr:hypothetical protein [Alphaproteobacteria bacterium]